jgi:class 3 adenylate cyclase
LTPDPAGVSLGVWSKRDYGLSSGADEMAASWVDGGAQLKISVGVKVFGVVLLLLALVSAVAWINARSAREVESLIGNVHSSYVPAYGALARANLRSVEEGLYVRRLIIARLLSPDDRAAMAALEKNIDDKAQQADLEFSKARQAIDWEIADPASFGDKLALSRLDTRIEFLQQRHADYEKLRVTLDAAIERGDTAAWKIELQQLDQQRDELNEETDVTRHDMLLLLDSASNMAAEAQTSTVEYGLVLLALALALGAIAAGIFTIGLVRPLRRLLRGTMLVQQGALETQIPVTSRDEVGELTASFNAMVRELRAKARIRETFGRYVDPRIVEGLIERPEALGGTGDRRVMTVFFCDMKGFTALSEGMTPAGMVRIVNRYLATMSEPIRRHRGIIDKYIGDAIMAFWGPPFTQADEQANLACMAGLEQLAALEGYRAELPELMGIKRVPLIDMRIGVATGEAIVGNIGSDVSMSYTVMGDAVNLASRLEGANKAYGTRFLVNELTAKMAGDLFEFREIDAMLVEGKQEPEHVFEVIGRKGELALHLQCLAEKFSEGLAAYRKQEWREAASAFRAALDAVPQDGPSKIFLERVQRLEASPPPADWSGVFVLSEK